MRSKKPKIADIISLKELIALNRREFGANSEAEKALRRDARRILANYREQEKALRALLDGRTTSTGKKVGGLVGKAKDFLLDHRKNGKWDNPPNAQQYFSMVTRNRGIEYEINVLRRKQGKQPEYRSGPGVDSG